MQWLRAQVARVAAGWLAVHLCFLVSAPTSLCSVQRGIVVEAAACKCAHTPGQACPMHHARRSTGTRAGSRLCACASADPLLATVASLLGPVAVLATPAPALAPPAAADCSNTLAATALDRTAVPESPPPRL